MMPRRFSRSFVLSLRVIPLLLFTSLVFVERTPANLFDDDIGIDPVGITHTSDSSETDMGDPPTSQTHSGPIGRVDERIADPECDACFIVPGLDNGRYQIFESIAVEGKEVVFRRDIPNPAPLAEGETRPTYDTEIKEDIWYIGNQAFVGPTDEEKFSESHTKTKVEMFRIKTRKEADIFGVPGVHGFGIGEDGFVVYLLPDYAANKRLISNTLDGVPVTVKVEDMPKLIGHADTYFRPVPTGAGISSQWWRGTLGPHVVRTAGGCCTIWTLTAAHVVMPFLNSTPPNPHDTPVYQPSVSNYNLFGYVTKAFNLRTCGTIAQCLSPSAYVNYTTERPDVAAIDPLPYGATDSSPHTPTETDVIRRLQKTPSSYKNGPSGMILTAKKGHKHRVWGSVYSASETGSVKEVGMTEIISGHGSNNYKVCCLNLVDRWGSSGDSGAAVTYSGTSKRHVAGVAMAQKTENGFWVKGVWYIPAADIKAAFENADADFHHYWGTKEGYRNPATTTCDPPGC